MWPVRRPVAGACVVYIDLCQGACTDSIQEQVFCPVGIVLNVEFSRVDPEAARETL